MATAFDTEEEASGGARRGDAFGRWIGHHPIAALAIAVVVIFFVWLLLAPWPAGFEDVFGKKRLFVNAVFNGITLGALYFLVATGFTLTSARCERQSGTWLALPVRRLYGLRGR